MKSLLVFTLVVLLVIGFAPSAQAAVSSSDQQSSVIQLDDKDVKTVAKDEVKDGEKKPERSPKKPKDKDDNDDDNDNGGGNDDKD
jgi:hypothetical protein